MKFKIKLFYLFLVLAGIGVFLMSCKNTYNIETLLEVAKRYQVDGAEYVGTETCEMCHEDMTKRFMNSSHNRIAIQGENFTVEGCEMCHGPGSLHVDSDGGVGVHIINPKKDPTVCFACHSEKKTEFELPFHHPVLEGHMSCTDCHDLHGEEGRKWTFTSMDDANETCFKCHEDKRGPFVFEHEAMREGCTTCHQVHGSINDKMLVERDNTLCLRCHTQDNFPTMGGFNHGGFPAGGSCSTSGCHPTAHRSSHTGLGVDCTQCHFVHGGHGWGGGGFGGPLLISGSDEKCLVCHSKASFSHTPGGVNHTFLARGSCFSGGCHTEVHGSNFDKHLRS